MTDRQLESTLRSVGAELAYPPTPDLSARVAARIRRKEWTVLAPSVQPEDALTLALSRRERGVLLGPRPAFASLAAALAIALFVATSPAAQTVADALGLRGLVISRLPDAPVGRIAIPPIGERSTLAEAQAAVPYRVLRPGVAAAEVRLDRTIAGGMVVLHLPDGALLTQFQAGLEPGFFAKGLGPETRIEQLTVNGGRGYWIEGRPHLFYYRARDGEIRDESIRLAGSVLLWEQAGLTLRLEGVPTLDAALRIAQSVQ